MNVKILSPLTAFAYDVAGHLESKGVAPVAVQTADVKSFQIRHRSTVPAREVARLLAALDYLQPADIAADDNLPSEIEVALGDAWSRDECEVAIVSDSAAHAEKLRELVNALGFVAGDVTVRILDEDVLMYGDAPSFPRQLLRWHAARIGNRPSERHDSDYEEALCLMQRDPLLAGKSLTERYGVSIASDDEKAAERLAERLSQQGFRVATVTPMSEADAKQARIALRNGPFTAKRAPAESARLRVAVEDLLTERGIDTKRFPVTVSDGDESALEAQFTLPLRACASGSKRPYSGPYPARFSVTIFTDNAEAVAGLKERLLAAGFDQLQVKVGQSVLDAAGASDFIAGFAIRWGAAGNESDVATAIRQAVQAEKQEADPESRFTLRVNPTFGADDVRVEVFFPHKGVRDGALMARVADPKSFALKLHAPDPGEWKELLDELKTWGFKTVATEESDSTSKDISYGGAPPELVSRLRTFLKTKTGIDMNPNKQWADSDMDVWFHLPRKDAPKKAAAAPVSEGGDWALLDHWASPEVTATTAAPTAVPFVEVAAEWARVGTIQLPRRPQPRNPLAPDPADFTHFCIDRLTAATIEHIAASVALREPCLLEGETSTSKTSSIFYLASLLNQPVVRLNLNGQTDTGELVGRFVPHNLRLELPLSRVELQAESEWLEPETRMILERAGSRSLTQVEIQQIMANEGMANQAWRWQDGMVVQALKNGWWVLLDEVNLAEPQILERLNSVLEHTPMLVLTENDNSVLGPGGIPVHPDFRIFATMNPAEYSGRSVLSPAYRDRWRGYWFTPRPTEGEYLDMLRRLVHGIQPAITVRGRGYAGSVGPAPFAGLAGLNNVDAFLQALARFQVSLEHAAGQASSGARIGARRKEHYVFTRRGVLSLMEYLCSPLAEHDGQLSTGPTRRALLRYYLGRAASAEDRDTIMQLLDAAGIGSTTWSIGS
jgi:MoxR-like ATPase